jgi:hypothetical protein
MFLYWLGLLDLLIIFLSFFFSLGFQIKWDINPNAASGTGVVAIVAESADGENLLIN